VQANVVRHAANSGRCYAPTTYALQTRFSPKTVLDTHLLM